MTQSEDLQERLAHVRWLGGSPCSGKSSIAEMVAERHGLCVYHVDKAFDRHRACFTPERHPTLTKWTRTPWNELWMQPADVLLSEAIADYTEHFEFILKDLLEFPAHRLVLAEGTALLPRCVAPLLSQPRQALWMVPTEQFQRTVYPERGEWVQGILATCDDPDAALKNWMDRDVAFAQWVLAETERLDLSSIVVDGTHTIETNAERVADFFGFANPTP
ncbi:MAG: hypothetical protein ACP5HG_05035 [Anaerolineae bacterium]